MTNSPQRPSPCEICDSTAGNPSVLDFPPLDAANQRPAHHHRNRDLNGAVRATDYIAIQVPLVRFIEGTVKSSMLSATSVLKQFGKPHRPCVITDQAKQQICLMYSFSGAEPPELLRQFLVPVYPTLGANFHVHSTPQWNHKWNQWILAVPITPPTQNVEHLAGWKSSAMPRGAHFDKSALYTLEHLISKIRKEWKTTSKTNPAAVRAMKAYLATFEDKMSAAPTCFSGMSRSIQGSHLTHQSYRSYYPAEQFSLHAAAVQMTRGTEALEFDASRPNAAIHYANAPANWESNAPLIACSA
ncbi:hypothetical protein MIND_01305400 [Mycena indigotica]|uniref:Uncharacterized protein n=1 Tax=Mycena indigotica TaxID=2126181 RepID=A0A8H6S250_9AGAR|nr:uncharacterized protein MIND_01305400 [Mycena indigotica]KAF7290651.1 hypothetical protein MIND_01305400 [Mycena indigotica]